MRITLIFAPPAPPVAILSLILSAHSSPRAASTSRSCFLPPSVSSFHASRTASTPAAYNPNASSNLPSFSASLPLSINLSITPSSVTSHHMTHTHIPYSTPISHTSHPHIPPHHTAHPILNTSPYPCPSAITVTKPRQLKTSLASSAHRLSQRLRTLGDG